jgi:serine/threonine protein kinase
MANVQTIQVTTGVIWTLGKKLGSGTYGSVYEATTDKGRKSAIKLFEKGAYSKKSWTDEKMMTALINAQCAGVVPILYTYGYDVGSGRYYMISELMDSSLLSIFPRTIKTMLEVFKAMTQCIQVLHTMDLAIAHLDIKPANFLINHSTGIIKIADFGMACNMIDTFCDDKRVTLIYDDPNLEKIRARGGTIRDYLPADVFALGVTFREMMYLYRSGQTQRSDDFYESEIVGQFKNPKVAYDDIPMSRKAKLSPLELKVLGCFDNMIRETVLVLNLNVRQDVHELLESIDTFLSGVVILKSSSVASPKSSSPEVHTGSQGGKYILKSGKKVYLKK